MRTCPAVASAPTADTTVVAHAPVPRRSAPLATAADLSGAATLDIAHALNSVLADVYALYLKTENFYLYMSMSAPLFRDDHLLFEVQAAELLAMADPLAARCRKMDTPTPDAIGDIDRIRPLSDNPAGQAGPTDMLAELHEDNQRLVAHLRVAHDLCQEHRDNAAAGPLAVWINQGERRSTLLTVASRRGRAAGRLNLAARPGVPSSLR